MLVTLYYCLQLVLSKTIRIGDIKYHIHCSRMWTFTCMWFPRWYAFPFLTWPFLVCAFKTIDKKYRRGYLFWHILIIPSQFFATCHAHIRHDALVSHVGTKDEKREPSTISWGSSSYNYRLVIIVNDYWLLMWCLLLAKCEVVFTPICHCSL